MEGTPWCFNVATPLRRGGAPRGLLLVEAILAAVVIAVGLVFISQGLASQLKALRTIEEYEVLLSLGQGRLLKLEALGLNGSALPVVPRGTFGRPYQGYRWTLTASARDDVTDANGNPLMSTVTITVQGELSRSPSVRLSAIWPMTWVPPEWF